MICKVHKGFQPVLTPHPSPPTHESFAHGLRNIERSVPDGGEKVREGESGDVNATAVNYMPYLLRVNVHAIP